MKRFLPGLFFTLIFAHEPKNRCVLVVGGAGYIGSCVNDALHESGYDTIVLDNLSQGHVATITKGTFIEGDLGDKELLNSLFSTYEIDAVMHFAAFLDVGESTKNPLKYYLNNVSATLNLLKEYLNVAQESALTGRTIPGKETESEHNDLLFALPANALGLYSDIKREAARTCIADLANLWERP